MPFKTKEEKSEYDKKRYRERRALKIAYMKQYRAEHPEVRKEWYVKNRTKVNEQKRKWRDASRDRVLELRQTYEESERAKELQKQRREKWAIENPLKNQETRLLACYRRKGLIGAGKVRKEDLNKLLENPNCGICKHPLEDKFHIDHIIPVSKGGKHELSNLQLAHPLCNLRKGAKVEIIAIGK